MAYMRGNPYVYESDGGLEVSTGGKHVTLDPVVFDALALMRICELLDDPDQFKKVWEEVESRSGNFGADAAMKLAGGPGGMDMLRGMLTKMSPNRRNEYEVCETCGTFLRIKEKT